MWNGLQNLVKFLHSNSKVFEHSPEARDLVAEVCLKDVNGRSFQSSCVI